VRSTRSRATGLRYPGLLLAAVTIAGAVTACSSGESPAPPPPPPPPPPAACLLDTTSLGAATGLAWAPEAITASDTRCVYDPSGPRPPEGPAFVTVDVAPAAGADPAAALDTVAALCEDGSRAPVGDDGFVCRFQSDSVFAAVVSGERMVTLAASAVPPGTTAARLVMAFDQQLAALGP
jgi:hypothetical protein